MVADPKALAVLISGKGKKGGEMPPPPDMEIEVEDEEQPEDEALQIAADEIIAAIQAGDSAALKESLKSFFEMC